MINVKKILNGGIDSDSSPQLIDDDAYLNAMDARMAISSNGRDKRWENIKGTTEITAISSLLPVTGTNFTIGTAVDRARGWILIFNVNSLGEDGIYAYDKPNNLGYIVLVSSNLNVPLNFSKSNRVNRNAKVIGDLLYWTDNSNQPRKVNYIAGIKTNQPAFVTDVAPYSLPIDYKVIAWIKRPPIYTLLYEKRTQAGLTANLTQENAFFFCYQYKYRDNELSPLSSFSDLCPFNTVPNYFFGGRTFSIRVSVAPDTFNKVFISVPYTEKVPDDVQQINIYVRYGEAGAVSVIKNYNKAIAADALAIANHNASVSQGTFLSFDFFNNVKGDTLGSLDIYEDDGTPLQMGTIESARIRQFAANCLLGYDSPTTTSLAVSSSTVTMLDSITTFHNYRGFRQGSKYVPSITFYDEFKRKCGSTAIGEYLMPNYNDWQTGTPIVNSTLNWTLSNGGAVAEIPDWAYYYSIDITKDLTCSSFLCANMNGKSGLGYAILQTDGTYTIRQNYDETVYAIVFNLELLNRQTMGYVFSDGDFCILTNNQNATVLVLKILGTSGINLLLEPRDIGNTADQAIWHWKAMIFTPRTKALNEANYERGNIYNVVNPTTNTRTYQTLSGSILGDIYAFSLAYAPYFGTKKLIVESMSPNYRQYKDWETSAGFANFVLLIGQERLKTTILFSNTYPSPRVNGLNRFQPLNRTDIGDSSGQIQQLILTNKKEEDGTVMLVITENDVSSAYLGEVQLVGASKNANLAIVNDVIGTINTLKLNSGTMNPESVFEYMGNVTWFDVKNGFISQYSSNGIFPVSDFKLNRFFKKYAEDYQNTNTTVIDTINGFHHICLCVDPYHREVMVTLPALIYDNYAEVLPSYSSVPPYATSIINRFDVYDKLGKTMSFDFQENKWRCNYSFLSEWMEQVDNQLFLFKNGKMHSHSTNASAYNTYFGQQYPLRLCASWNLKETPSVIKDVFEVAIEGNVAPYFSVLMSTYPWTQLTDLSPADWKQLEGVYFASWFRDRLSVNTGTANPDENLYKGDVVKSAYPFVMFEWQQYAALMYVNFIQMGFGISRGTQMLLNK